MLAATTRTGRDLPDCDLAAIFVCPCFMPCPSQIMTAHLSEKLFPIAQRRQRARGRTRPGDQHRSTDLSVPVVGRTAFGRPACRPSTEWTGRRSGDTQRPRRPKPGSCSRWASRLYLCRPEDRDSCSRPATGAEERDGDGPSRRVHSEARRRNFPAGWDGSRSGT
jgi:hypothetical protein